MKLKKVPLIGNLAVSLLSVLVIYLTILFIDTVNYTNEFQVLLDNSYDPLFHIRIKWIIFIFMGMAFVQNLAREIVKDIEDVEGDKVIGARTIPMILGNRKTLILSGVFLSLFPSTAQSERCCKAGGQTVLHRQQCQASLQRKAERKPNKSKTEKLQATQSLLRTMRSDCHYPFPDKNPAHKRLRN